MMIGRANSSLSGWDWEKQGPLDDGEFLLLQAQLPLLENCHPTELLILVARLIATVATTVVDDRPSRLEAAADAVCRRIEDRSVSGHGNAEFQHIAETLRQALTR